MPASRIAFALADFISEVRALLPKDHKLGIMVRLDPVAFNAVIYQLAEYGGIARSAPSGPSVDHIEFGGVRIERIVDPIAGACACLGPQNGEPLCPCGMRAAQEIAARGRFVRRVDQREG